MPNRINFNEIYENLRAQLFPAQTHDFQFLKAQGVESPFNVENGPSRIDGERIGERSRARLRFPVPSILRGPRGAYSAAPRSR